jgi:prepilin-type processing-associated H-X9-DG protein
VASSFPDGTSNTILAAETYAGPHPGPLWGNNGGWGSGYGTDQWSPVFADTYVNAGAGDGYPTMYCPAPCMFVVQPSPWKTAIPSYNTAPAPYTNMRRLIYSPHPGGINVTLGDGSVRFVSGSIQPNTWWSALTPAGGEVIPSDW